MVNRGATWDEVVVRIETLTDFVAWAPWRGEKDHICLKPWVASLDERHEIAQDEIDPVRHPVDCGIMPATLEALLVAVDCNYPPAPQRKLDSITWVVVSDIRSGSRMKGLA